MIGDGARLVKAMAGSQAAGATKSNKKEKQWLLPPSERRKPFRKSERQGRQGLSLSASILQTTAYLSPSFRGHPWGPWPRSHSSKLLTISSSRWMIAPCDSITWLNVPIAELVVPMADVTVALNSVADWTNAVVLVASFSTIPSSRSTVSSSRVRAGFVPAFRPLFDGHQSFPSSASRT